MTADGPIDPMPWWDFAQVLAQFAVLVAAGCGIGLVAMNLRTRWRREPDRPPLNLSLLKVPPPPPVDVEPTVETPGSPWSVSSADSYDTPCVVCRHPIGAHDDLGRCVMVECLAAGDDQICVPTYEVTRVLDHALFGVNWSLPSHWSLFCRSCGHRVAHHIGWDGDRLLCPRGPKGPGHDG